MVEEHKEEYVCSEPSEKPPMTNTINTEVESESVDVKHVHPTVYWIFHIMILTLL